METQGDLHHSYVDAMAAMHLSPKHEVIKKRALMEVFAVRVIAPVSEMLKRRVGLILLKSSDQIYCLYEGFNDEICDHQSYNQYNSDGYLILIGPQRGVEVKDTVVLYPWLFDTILVSWNKTEGNLLWKGGACCPSTDQFIRRGIVTDIGLMEVNYAVYADGVEACLEVSLSNLNVKEGLLQVGNVVAVYGSIKASNNALIHSEAKSVLFNHMTSQESIKLSAWPPEQAELSIPLTRNAIAIPRESALLVDVCLYLSCASQNPPIAVGSVMFDAYSRSISSTVQEQIIPGVKVKVAWSI